MKNNIIVLIILGLFITLILSVRNNKKEIPIQTKNTIKTEKITDLMTMNNTFNETHKKLFKEEFIKGCKEGGGNDKYCECGYNYLENSNIEEVMSLQEKLNKGETPTILLKTHQHCMNLY